MNILDNIFGNGKSWKTTVFGTLSKTLTGSGTLILGLSLDDKMIGVGLVIAGVFFGVLASMYTKDSNVTTLGTGENVTVKKDD